MRTHPVPFAICLILAVALLPAAVYAQPSKNAKAHDQRRANAAKHYARAQQFEADGKFAAAEAQYRVALKLDPGYTDARARLGYTRHRQGDLEEAIHIFEDIIRGEPRYNDAYVLIADSLFVIGRFADAWNYVHQAEAHGFTVPRSLRSKLGKKHREPPRAKPKAATAAKGDDGAKPQINRQSSGKNKGHSKGKGRGKNK